MNATQETRDWQDHPPLEAGGSAGVGPHTGQCSVRAHQSSGGGKIQQGGKRGEELSVYVRWPWHELARASIVEPGKQMVVDGAEQTRRNQRLARQPEQQDQQPPSTPHGQGRRPWRTARARATSAKPKARRKSGQGWVAAPDSQGSTAGSNTNTASIQRNLLVSTRPQGHAINLSVAGAQTVNGLLLPPPSFRVAVANPVGYPDAAYVRYYQRSVRVRAERSGTRSTQTTEPSCPINCPVAATPSLSLSRRLAAGGRRLWLAPRWVSKRAGWLSDPTGRDSSTS